MCAITVAAGLLQVLFGVSRVARAALAISPPVVHAMLAGIGITITVGQLHVLLGGAAGTDAITNLAELPGQLIAIHYPAALVGLAVIAVVLIWPRLPRPLQHIPAPLVAVVGTTALATAFALEVERVAFARLGARRGEPASGTWWQLGWGAHRRPHRGSDRQRGEPAVSGRGGQAECRPGDQLRSGLIGQGTANTMSGMLGGLPVTGVIVRSSTNVAAGARTRASAVLHGVWVGVFAVLFIGLIELIPLAVLAGLLVVIGLRLVKLADLRCAHRQGELMIYLVTVAGVVFLNLLEGVLIGLGLSLLMVLRRVVWSGVHAQQVWPAADDAPATWRVVVEGTLSFLAVPRLSRVLAQLPRGSHVVVEMVVDFLDHAAYAHLAGWQQQHEAGGGTVVIDELGPARRNAGVREYHQRCAPEVRPQLTQLADRQHPRALFLTCADSRVVPSMITSSGPGDLFTVRNIGNLVPPSGMEADSSVAASLEYAVNHLGVPSILVCGHSGCAAMHGLLDGAIVDGSLGRWLCWGLPSLQALRDGHPVGVAAAQEGRNEVDQLSMVNVARQVEVIRRHPAVRGAVGAGRVQVTGLFLDIRTARLLLLDPDGSRFVAVPDDYLPDTSLTSAYLTGDPLGAGSGN